MSIIIVGGGLSGLSAAHECYLRGSKVVLLDKQSFLSGNSGKATSGINGALTRTQTKLGISDLVEQFYQDTLNSAKDRANPELINVLVNNSADAVHWLQDVFELDLSLVSRLGGSSQPRTHRGHDSKFPGMAITYRLMERLEDLSETDDRVTIMKTTQVIDLIIENHKCIGVKWKNLETKEKGELYGPVIMATGGYAADFTKNSLLRKYRPDIYDLPTTNGTHATGDGQKIILKNLGVGIDLDKVQVHPTGLIPYDDTDTINQISSPRYLFLGAEALRGEGGILVNSKGERFVNELGTRDYVSGEIEKQVKMGNGPIRLILNESAASNLQFHVKHYEQRNLMRSILGQQLADDLKIDPQVLKSRFSEYTKQGQSGDPDQFGKQFFPNLPLDFEPETSYHVSFVTRVLHFTMGGVKINNKLQVLHQDDTPIQGLYACGELAGGVHGHNRLGGSSLLACVVYGKLAGDQASSYLLRHLSQEPSQPQTALTRLNQIHVHIDPENQRIIVEYGSPNKSSPSSSEIDSRDVSRDTPKSYKTSTTKPSTSKPLPTTSQEFTPEEVAKHNNTNDCWVIVKNTVLDLTKFMTNHPGGAQSILNFAGKDATENFEMLHEDNVIKRYAPECVIGVIKGKSSGFDLR